MSVSPFAHTTVLITGASSGIGLALARQFAGRGYKLVLASSDEKRLKAAAASLPPGPVSPVCIVQDLSQPGGALELVTAIRAHAISIDILVNNAGFGTTGPFTATDYARETSEMQLNMVALTQLTKLLLPEMLARGHGRILNVASVAAFFPGPYMAVYYATKAYVLHLSEALAEEVRGSGVTVSALCPGPTSTNFAAQAGAAKKPLFSGRLPTADEVAGIGYSGLIKGKPIIICSVPHRLLLLLLRCTPRRVVVRLIARQQQ